MNLESTAKVTEISASIAVLISLVVLIFEVRENTDSVRRASYESLTSELFEWRLAMAEDESLHSLFYRETRGTKGEDGWFLDGEDRHRFQVYTQALWHIYEQAFYANRYGDLGEEEWQRFEDWICVQQLPRVAWFAPRGGLRAVMSKPFVAFVESCRTDLD